MSMDDRYLYRAKRVDNGEWVEGFYFCMTYLDGRHTHHFIIPLGADLILGTPVEKIQVEVDPDTICRCTGLKDKHGSLIWENDILHNGNYFVVKWNAPCARFDIVLNNSHNIPMGKWEPMICDWKTNDFKEYRKAVDYEVIGNIFDNQELDKYKNMEDCENYYDDEQEWDGKE